ncbi:MULTISPECIES: hypothetical protein [unclassified Wolbachia]|uniref:hypothetical protein n=2 Tax=Wolbachia TaxID=953 RepID=UPI001AE3BD42|nr:MULTISPECIES: hypothetical protein [unclassified Wolbachia]MDX5497122.1 hypothetical protein [Wolbachia endosymbiont of Nomada fabriciana]MDX5528391.1 hypothetical protein [Wolbachia endosymbiont of Andrena minutula]QTP62348.1 hypothetical protein HUB92_05925 [Wolbachia endosymbiont of Wiebesia pumilae]
MSLWERIMYNFKGLDKLAIEELQKRVGELEKVSGNFAGLEQEVIKLSGEFTGNFKELLGKFDGLNDKFDGLQEKLTGLQENFTGLEEKVKTLTEAVADQEKIMATCIIVSAVAAIAVASFVAFCIYQGVKLDKEKKNDLSKDTPDAKLSNVDTTDGTEKLQNNLKVANI